MKRFIQFSFLFCAILLASCAKEEQLTEALEQLPAQVDKIAAEQLEVPSQMQLEKKGWKIADWDVNIYEGTEKVGNWNAYSNTITASEKELVYFLNENNFYTLLQTTQKKSEGKDSTFAYTYHEDGILQIENVQLIVKMDGEDLLIYYAIDNSSSVGNIFKVSVDNTYGKDLNENSMTGLGIIRLSSYNPEGEIIDSPISNFEFVEKFLAQEEILNGTYLEVSKTDNYVFVLSNGNRPAVAIKFSQFSELELDNERAETLFNAFLFQQEFTFLDRKLFVDSISFAGNSKTLLHVVAHTATASRAVFLYDTTSDIQSWVEEPEAEAISELPSYELAQRFHDKDNIQNKQFESIAITSDPYIFKLKGEQYPDDINIAIANQTIDLSNITPSAARELFEAFFNKTPFTFNGLEINLTEIKHVTASPYSFIVYGQNSATGESTIFWYETTTGTGKWGADPLTIVVSSYEFAQNFHDREPIGGFVYKRITRTDEANTFNLTPAEPAFCPDKVTFNQNIDVSDIIPAGARPLFDAFFNGTVFLAGQHSVMIDSISTATDANALLVNGKLEGTQEDVAFFYITNTSQIEWLNNGEENSMPAYELVQKFTKQEAILGVNYASMTLGVTPFTVVLKDAQGENTQVISFSDQTIELSDVLPHHALLLFESFLMGRDFNYKGIEVDIQKIELNGPFFGGEGWDYEWPIFVSALTNNQQEPVSFYMDLTTGTNEWWVVPSEIDGNTIDGYLLAQQFHYRDAIFGLQYDAIKTTSKTNEFVLSKMFHEDKTISLSSVSADQADVPRLAIPLFNAFFSHSAYSFLDALVNISMIIPSDVDNQFVVDGVVDNTDQAVRFKIDTLTGEKEWIISPTAN